MSAAEPDRTETPPGAGESNRFDLLRLPGVGRFLRWRWSRTVLQIPVLSVAVVMVWHAFLGPSLAPKNLAALLTWVHFRGVIVLVLLLGGNFFCMACPFLLPRELARRWLSPRWDWPVSLRNKLPAALLFVLVLFLYEWLDLWSDPWGTGIMIVGYFALAFLVDLLFRRASFCKYVCPVGQFNFLGAVMSPLEVTVRNPVVCDDCTTKDCIRGRFATLPESVAPAVMTAPSATMPDDAHPLPILQRGCELDLFQPRKVGNLDCTFCLDCVYACPHDNVGILSRLPAEELVHPGTRSGIGLLDQRADWSLLMIVFVFGAVLNAFAMVSPVYTLQQAIAHLTGLAEEGPILALIFAAGLVIEPAVMLLGAAWLTRRLTGLELPVWTVLNRFTRSLVPLGFGVWLAHYSFHFLTGFLTVIPVTQQAFNTLFGRRVLGRPLWHWGGLPEAAVTPIEYGFLLLGLMGSLFVAWRLASQTAPRQTGRAFTPWCCVCLLLFGAACWILNEPMDMRGTFVAN